MSATELACYLRAIRTTHAIPRLHEIARELEEREPNDEATLPLLKMIGLKVRRLTVSN